MNETHNKVFAIRGTDTAQVTFGRSDDVSPMWAPDGGRFLFVRGWRASETRYQQNVFLADSSGRIERPITDTRWQDQSPAWSTAGTQIAFARDSASVWSIWVADGDGTNAWNVTEEMGLPRRDGRPSFAPDDRRLAVLYPDTGSSRGALYVVDLADRLATPLRGTIVNAVEEPAVWSPDGRWLAYRARHGDARRLWVVSAEEPMVPALVAELPLDLSPHDWRAGKRRFVSKVELLPAAVTLRTSRGVRVIARVLTPDGEAPSSVLRWSAEDTMVASVDDLGFVRGRHAGSTRLVASAGGVRADTAMVTVTAAPIDTLFDEDWTGGFDTTRWIPFGFPHSVVVSGAPPDGRPAFFNNGDYNHGSGAVSVQLFEVGDEGLTLETEAWLPFTGQHWQIWQIALADDPFASGPEISGGPLAIGVSGPEPTAPAAHWMCAEAVMPTAPRVHAGHWVRIALVVRPDGWSECRVDGRRFSARQVPKGLLERPLAIVLRGHSVGTRIYHGRVVVTRGLPY